MAGKRIEMKNVHSIVLMLSQGYGTKHISASLGCARNTVKAYRAIIASKGVSYEALLSSPEEELERFFVSKKPEEDDRMSTLEDAFKNADGELGKVGVTKFLLWNEYRLSNPDGYSYPQFCKLYRERAETVDVTMHVEHKPGDKLYIDYTGKKNTLMSKPARASLRSALRRVCDTHWNTMEACLRSMCRTTSRAPCPRLTNMRRKLIPC